MSEQIKIAGFSIQYGNALIGKFMGKNYESPLNYMYDNDWNELMKVVDKIHSLDTVETVSITPTETMIYLKGSMSPYIQSPCVPGNTSLRECWIACVMFLIRRLSLTK